MQISVPMPLTVRSPQNAVPSKAVCLYGRFAVTARTWPVPFVAVLCLFFKLSAYDAMGRSRRSTSLLQDAMPVCLEGFRKPTKALVRTRCRHYRSYSPSGRQPVACVCCHFLARSRWGRDVISWTGLIKQHSYDVDRVYETQRSCRTWWPNCQFSSFLSERCQFRISARRPAVVTEVFHRFSQSLQTFSVVP
jgi:hypothetical protein